MLKVFLVEDERIIRETLRDTLPWTQQGYEFVGEASDGEMALPLIRERKPDVLITDIRMPFMDGLTLSRQVLQELPGIKVIILSGYDDFEYAQQAVSLGVERYLLKPITKTTLISVLEEVKAKIEGERVQRSYLQRFRQEAQDYEQYARRRFFEQMVLGQLSALQIREGSHQLGIRLDAAAYNIAMISTPPERHAGSTYSEAGARIREELVACFLKYPEYVLFRWNLTTYAVLIRGDEKQMRMLRDRCVGDVSAIYETHGPGMNWHMAVGRPVNRLERLTECFEEVSRLWAGRYMDTGRHILTDGMAVSAEAPGGPDLWDLDESKVHPAVITGVLQSAGEGEIPGFVDSFVSSLGRVLEFQPFCQYLMLGARFAATAFVRSLELEPEDVFSDLDCLHMVGRTVTAEEVKRFLSQLLLCTVRLRDQASGSQCRNLLKQAVGYIDANYHREDISLNKVAQKVNISANYLSAVFSQEMGTTFVEYLTARRMEKARELLRGSQLRSGEIALAVGYKDPHYFSFLFKKTQGCTPRDYRAGKGQV